MSEFYINTRCYGCGAEMDLTRDESGTIAYLTPRCDCPYGLVRYATEAEFEAAGEKVRNNPAAKATREYLKDK